MGSIITVTSDWHGKIPNDLKKIPSIRSDILINLGDHPNGEVINHQILPLSIQEKMLTDSEKVLRGMADFYRNLPCKRITVEGNVDAHYFDCYNSTISQGKTVKKLLGNSVEYVDKLAVRVYQDFILVLMPFFSEVDTPENITLLNDALAEQARTNHPLLVAMHGQPTQLPHGDATPNFEQFHHLCMVKDLLLHLNRSIDFLFYGNMREKLINESESNGFYTFVRKSNFVPTKYLHEGEVFTFDVERINEVKSRCRSALYN